MSYRTIRKEAEGEFEEKKSLFIGSAKRVSTEAEAREFINFVKSRHKEARHNVFAYVLGENCGIQRYSDDGEPQGTGGIPVLEVIKRNEITDTVVVVTRYFGGILLGASGLCRAYSKASALAVKNSGVVDRVTGLEASLTIPYDLLGKVQYLFNQNRWQIQNIEYTDKVVLRLLCESDKLQEIEKAVVEAASNRYDLIKLSEGEYFLEDGVLYEE
jgi:uncharacterized YigZ family protein